METAEMTLIPIQTNNEGIRTVNARDLHTFLEVGRDFTTWIKGRIGEYKFKENQDFVVFTKTGENPQGGRPEKEYHITIDMAKELSMVERTEKGHTARQYFIQCEKIAKGEGLSPAEHLLAQAKIMVHLEREQNRLAIEQRLLTHEQEVNARRISELEDRLMAQKQTVDYYTVSGYANLIGMKIPLDLANRLGKAATRLSKEHDVLIGKTSDVRFGYVNSYHIDILREIMGIRETRE